MSFKHCCLFLTAALVGLQTVSAQTKPASAATGDREARRSQQRASYRPLTLPDASGPRREITLSGNWLFVPSTSSPAASGASPAQPDDQWHVLAVPQFWNEIEWWIYYKARGTSHNFTQLERERCESFTFDSVGTRAGWYRQWIDVPKSDTGKRFTVHFDAVASAAEVFWNGEKIGTHAGMFSPFDCEATAHVRPGERNLLAVYVAAIGHDPKASSEVAAVAVTMSVTQEMLRSMPHSTYPTSMAGIWQPVKLVVTSDQRLDDVYFRPSRDRAVIETTVSGADTAGLVVRHQIFDRDPREAPNSPRLMDERGNDHWQAMPSATQDAAAKKQRVDKVEVTDLHPRLWSPEHPNLYWLRTELLRGETVVDERLTQVGFRTFETRDGKFYLNGKPYFLRGANMPPAGLEPNNQLLAERFMKLAHDGNEMVTRFHMCPPPAVWMDAADRQGVGVSIEGSWPWVCIDKSDVPDDRLRKIWYDEMEEIARANRNHPSFLLLTMANESHFQGVHDPDMARKTKKYKFFSDAIRLMRATAVGVPIVLHSGYLRVPTDFDKAIAPNGLDDGDVDDGHYYFGWYTQSPFRLDIQKDVEQGSKYNNRPFISQEASTGYPDNDTGHAAESYIRVQRTPQIWVGHYGLQTERPEPFLETQALITKEMAEKVRRDRQTLDGWGLFASSCWFRDVYDAEFITPYPVYWAVKRAYAPVLVSLVTANRHYSAGQTFTSDVVICNDDPDRPTLRNLSVHWRMTGMSSDPGTSGDVKVPNCEYDGRTRVAATFAVPEKLPEERSELTLTLELRSGDEVVSVNEYAILALAKSAQQASGGKLVVVESEPTTSAFLSTIGYDCKSVKAPDWGRLTREDVVVVASDADVGDRDAFGKFLQHGTALLLEAGIKPGPSPITPQETSQSILASIPGFPVATARIVGTSGDFVDCLAPDLLAGLHSMDMHWWTAQPNDVVRVCRAAYQLPETPGVIGLARHVQPHAYITDENWPKFISWPVLEIPNKDSAIIVSSVLLADDPVARRFHVNIIERLRKRAAGQQVDYVLKLAD